MINHKLETWIKKKFNLHFCYYQLHSFYINYDNYIWLIISYRDVSIIVSSDNILNKYSINNHWYFWGLVSQWVLNKIQMMKKDKLSNN